MGITSKTEMTLALSDGSMFEFPMFDPVVANFVKNPNNLIDTIIHQINVEKLYARFFEGKKHLTFLDIGANIGLVSAYASPACDIIVSLEPAPETYEVLRSVTRPFKNIMPVQAALAPNDGEVEFFVNDINSTASSTVNTYGKRIKVPGMQLSDILRIYQLEQVDVCKCDAEGGEGDSLTFTELKIAQPVVNTWYIETHNCPKSSWNDKMGQLIRNLTLLGYLEITINGMALEARKP